MSCLRSVSIRSLTLGLDWVQSVTSYHCVVDTGVEEGSIVGIWGAGPIGLVSFRDSASTRSHFIHLPVFHSAMCEVGVP